MQRPTEQNGHSVRAFLFLWLCDHHNQLILLVPKLGVLEYSMSLGASRQVLVGL